MSSKLIVCPPPIDKIIEAYEKLLKKELGKTPDFIDLPEFCGFNFPWPVWSKNENWYLRSHFLNYEEFMMIEYIDPNTWKILDLSDNLVFSEIFNAKYKGETGYELTVYEDFIRFASRDGAINVDRSFKGSDINFLKTIKDKYKPALVKLEYRGYFERPDVKSETKFYLKILNNEYKYVRQNN